MSRAPKKSIKPSSESSKPSNLDETIRRKQEIATLETNLSNLTGESESLLTIERKLRNEIQQITSEQSRYRQRTHLLLTEKRRLARDLETNQSVAIEEMESALVTQAVEKDMCEESIAGMERDLDSKLDRLRGTLSEVKIQEQEAVEKLNMMLSQIKSKLEHLNLTVTQFN